VNLWREEQPLELNTHESHENTASAKRKPRGEKNALFKYH